MHYLTILIFVSTGSLANAGFFESLGKKIGDGFQSVGNLGASAVLSTDGCRKRIQAKIIASTNQVLKECPAFVSMKDQGAVPKPPDDKLFKCTSVPGFVKERQLLKTVSCNTIKAAAMGICTTKIRADESYDGVCKSKFQDGLIDGVETEIKAGIQPPVKDNPISRESANLLNLCETLGREVMNQCLNFDCFPIGEKN